MAKPLKWMFLIALVLAAGAFLFFLRMYRTDIRSLEGFRVAYDGFDAAMAESIQGGRAEGLSRAGEALTGLQAAASMRISSLIRNDAELMDQARTVAAFARQELDAFGAFRALPGGPDAAPNEAAERERSSEQAKALREKRAAAYARFLDLAGLNHRTSQKG